jgi:hypothetical protein
MNRKNEKENHRMIAIFLDQTIRTMNEAVHVHPSDFLFSLDEVGTLEWEDRKSKWVVVAMMPNGRTVHHSGSWNLKHLSIVTYMSAAGQCLPPDLVTSQASEPVRRCLSAIG